MFATKHGFVIVLLLTALVGPAAAQRRRNAVVVPRPPSVNVNADRQTVTVCTREELQGAPRVRLTAVGNSPDGLPLRYAWSATGGRIVGDGTNTDWDLTGVTPGYYVATVEVNSGTPDANCMAFATVPVAVVECPPQPDYCPNISISAPDSVQPGTAATFTADVSGGTPGARPSYIWTVTGGSIINGQGTPTISVAPAGAGGQEVGAALTVNGFGGLNCNASTLTTVLQPPPPPIRPRAFDEFGDIARNDEKARLDVFANELQNDPRAQGYVVVSGGQGGQAQQRAAGAKQYLINSRGLEAGRVVTLQGRPGGPLRVQLWLVPAGAEPPTVP